MKTFKELSEALEFYQKPVAKMWRSGALSISSHVIPHGQHHIDIPLEPDNEIHRHLTQHCFEPIDHEYAYEPIENTKRRKVGNNQRRKLSIGKILTQTEAPDELIKKHAVQLQHIKNGNPVKQSDLFVRISRRKTDVAGMSTNQAWTSCMNWGHGIFPQKETKASEYLRNEVGERNPYCNLA